MSHHEELIRDVPLLARLPEAELRALASHGRMRSYRSGAVLFREGDPGDSLHIVMEGGIRITVLWRLSSIPNSRSACRRI